MSLEPRGSRGCVGTPVLAEAAGDGEGADVCDGVLGELGNQCGRRSRSSLDDAETGAVGGGHSRAGLEVFDVGGEGGAGEGSENDLDLHDGLLWREVKLVY